MQLDDPFQGIWENYRTLKDCLKLAQRAVTHKAVWMQRTQFEGMTATEAQDQITPRFEDLENLTFLALWTRFERYIIEYLQLVGNSLTKTEPASVIKQLREQLADAIERRRFDELLDLFKEIVEPQRLGDAKNVKKYRDWIIHQNPRISSPGKVEAATTRDILSDIIAAIRGADSDAP